MRVLIASGLSVVMLFTLTLVGDGGARAHEIRPMVAEVEFAADGRLTVSLDIILEASMAKIEAGLSDTDDSANAELYDRLRALPPAELEARFADEQDAFADGFNLTFDGQAAPLTVTEIAVAPLGDVRVSRNSTVVLSGAIPPGADVFIWDYPASYGAVAVKLRRAGDADFTSAWLQAGERSDPFPMQGLVPERGTFATLVDYVELGYIHIVPRGLDHILFVLGLFLLSTRMRPLLIQVTCFTVAHSITLALSLYDLVELPPSIVEPLIALSIAYVAIENLFMRGLSPWRPVVVFAFGLLHGLGFAGVLTELGLPQDQFVTALVGFNVGVEFGQLSVILAAWLLLALWQMSETTYRRTVIIPGSLCIAAVGLYWTFERVVYGV